MTQEAFDTFLDWLSKDRDEAARLYESIRRRLIIFIENRPCAFAEELADETIDRVIQKVPTFEGKYEGDPVPYFYSVARFVCLKHQDEQKRRYGGAVNDATPQGDQPAEARLAELCDVCLDTCLQKLKSEQRQQILNYYREDKGAKIEDRKLTAERVGESLNALRIQVHRLRGKLRPCIEDCVERQQVW